MTDTTHISISSDQDVVIARMRARDMAKHIGFGAVDQARVATAVSELARNIVLYAGIGSVKLRRIERGGRSGLEIVCTDTGPGIADIAAAMQDGYSRRAFQNGAAHPEAIPVDSVQAIENGRKPRPMPVRAAHDAR